MLIEKLEKPVDGNTHSVTSSHNGMVTTIYVDAKMAELFQRAITFGEHRAYSQVRELLKFIMLESY